MQHPLEQRLIRSLFSGCLPEGKSIDVDTPVLFDEGRSVPNEHMVGGYIAGNLPGSSYFINDDILKDMGTSTYNLSTSNLKGLLREDLEVEGFEVKLALLHKVGRFKKFNSNEVLPIYRLLIICKDTLNDPSPLYIIEKEDMRQTDDHILEDLCLNEVSMTLPMEEDFIHEQAAYMMASIFNSDSLDELAQFFKFTKELNISRLFDFAADKIPPAFMGGMQQFFETAVSSNEQSIALDPEINSIKWRVSPHSLEDVFVTAVCDDGESDEMVMEKNMPHSVVFSNPNGQNNYATASQIRNKVIAHINKTGNYEGEITNLDLKYTHPEPDKKKVSP